MSGSELSKPSKPSDEPSSAEMSAPTPTGEARTGGKLPGPFTIVAAEVRGPLPPPEVLAKYADINPNLVTEIIDRARAEQAHRHQMDRARQEVQSEALRNEALAITKQSGDIRLGQYLGALTAVTFLGGGVWMGLVGQPWLGGVIVGAIGVGIVSALVNAPRGTSSKAKSPAGE